MPNNNILPPHLPAPQPFGRPREAMEAVQRPTLRTSMSSEPGALGMAARTRSSASPLFGDSLRQSQSSSSACLCWSTRRLLVDTLAASASEPRALASSHSQPGLATRTPHVRPRVWLPSPRPIDEDAVREEAIRTLRRGVGIVFAKEHKWHARPATSQMTWIGL